MNQKHQYIAFPADMTAEQLRAVVYTLGGTLVGDVPSHDVIDYPILHTLGEGIFELMDRDTSVELAYEGYTFQDGKCLVANKILMGAEITDRHPQTGEHTRGTGFVTATVDGVQMPHKQVGSYLVNPYVMGTMTEMQVAAKAFWPQMLQACESRYAQQRTPVRLTFEQVGFHLLTEDERTRILTEHEQKMQEFDVLAGRDPSIRRDLPLIKDLLTQRMYRQVLETTRPRMDRMDAAGQDIMTAEQWNVFVETHSESEVNAMKESVTAPLLIGEGEHRHAVQVDKGIASVLQRMNREGFETGQSCSGMLADHPNYRYVKDDHLGRFVKGENISWGKQGSGAYLTFWKPEAEAVRQLGWKVNTPQQIQVIRDACKAQGWECIDTEVFWQPSLRIAPAYTYDGTGRCAIIDEASERCRMEHPGLYEQNFFAWLDRKSEIQVQVEREHGGVVMYSDKMLQGCWEQLATALEQGMEQVRRQQEEVLQERITDVSVYNGPGGRVHIRCCIDGVQQMGRPLDGGREVLDNREGWHTLAMHSFRDVLDGQRDRAYSLGR